MTAPDDMTIGELNRTMVQIRDSLNSLALKFDAYILKEVYEVEQESLRRQIGDLKSAAAVAARQKDLDDIKGGLTVLAKEEDLKTVKDNIRWLGRTVGGAIIVAVVGALFAGGVIHP